MATSEGSRPQTSPPRWIGTELGTRVLSAIVLAIVALLATYEGGWAFTLFWLAAAIAVLAEWLSMTRTIPRLPLQVLLGGGLCVLTAQYLAGSGIAAAGAVGVGAILACAIVGQNSRNRLWAASGFVYAAVIALVPPIVRDHPEFGMVGLLWMFAVVWTTDVAAYFTGRRLGGPKLWPRVSPKKTWSGFAGGSVGGTVAGLLVVMVAGRFGWGSPASPGIVAVLSLLASVASQLGDLGESALKRTFDVKDSSRLIPGHGGVMDRLDGFWAVALLAGFAIFVSGALAP